MSCRVALVRTDVSEECFAFIIMVKIIRELVFLRSVLQLLVTANVVPNTSSLVTLMMDVLCSSETSVLIRATWRNIQEGGILHNFNIGSVMNRSA
jgi:hypothetical protein